MNVQFEGDSRHKDGGFNIGFDELVLFYPVYLSVVRRCPADGRQASWVRGN